MRSIFSSFLATTNTHWCYSTSYIYRQEYKQSILVTPLKTLFKFPTGNTKEYQAISIAWEFEAEDKLIKIVTFIYSKIEILCFLMNRKESEKF